MNFKSFSVFILTGILSVVLLLPGCTESKQGAAEPQLTPTEPALEATSSTTTLFGAKGAAQDEQLTEEEMLVYAMEEEYLARAMYGEIINRYGSVKPFSNLLKAEEKHVKTLTPLFSKYGYDVTEDNAKEYLNLPENIKDTLQAGIQAETDKVAMYERFLKEPLKDDMKKTFNNLMEASKKQLESLQKIMPQQ